MVNSLKISTKGRYALRLMLDLALNDSGEYISIRDIAARQELSGKYLEQIITILSRGGCVTSVRGSQGGYRLVEPPENYTVGRILRLTEGSLAPVTCLESGRAPCSRADQCVTLEVWQKIQQAVEEVVDSITLADLVRNCQEKDAAAALPDDAVFPNNLSE